MMNLLDSESMDDVITFSKVEHKALNNEPYKIEYASYEEVKHADSWEYENFNYSYNCYGFRDVNDIPSSIDIGAFGCSFTAGLGLPESMLWHKVLAKKTNKTSFNFGLAGASAKTTMDLFLIASKHINMKDAVFLLPSHRRIQIASKHPIQDRISHLSLVPSVRSELAFFHGIDSDAVFKIIPEEEVVKVFTSMVYLTEYVAKHRNINVYFSSWDADSYKILQNLKLTHGILLPDWRSESGQQALTDLARDKKHPGPIHHAQWVDKILDYMK